jgi:lysophospholipase L1-like esterase
MRRLFALAALVTAACAIAPAEAQSVRVVGRSVAEPGGFTVQWSGAGFEARFTGPILTATIEDGGESIYEIDVDGRTTVVDLDAGSKPYTLWSGPPGTHVVRVTRRTGVNSGPTRFTNIRAQSLASTPTPDRRILVIGDSISTGYGVGGVDQSCGFTYPTEIATEAYPVLTARTYGADVHVIAIDGFGLVRNYDGGAFTMRAASWRTSPWDETRWPVSSWQPHAIVVNLGTNDFGHGDPGEGYDRAYVEFLGELRAAYPQAQIYAAIGPMLNGEILEAARASVRAAIRARNDAGDRKIEFLTFTPAETGRVWGCDWHPGRDTQKGMSLALNHAISRSLGWTPVPAGVSASGRPQ